VARPRTATTRSIPGVLPRARTGLNSGPGAPFTPGMDKTSEQRATCGSSELPPHERPTVGPPRRSEPVCEQLDDLANYFRGSDAPCAYES